MSMDPSTGVTNGSQANRGNSKSEWEDFMPDSDEDEEIARLEMQLAKEEELANQQQSPVDQDDGNEEDPFADFETDPDVYAPDMAGQMYYPQQQQQQPNQYVSAVDYGQYGGFYPASAGGMVPLAQGMMAQAQAQPMMMGYAPAGPPIYGEMPPQVMQMPPAAVTTHPHNIHHPHNHHGRGRPPSQSKRPRPCRNGLQCFRRDCHFEHPPDWQYANAKGSNKNSNIDNDGGSDTGSGRNSRRSSGSGGDNGSTPNMCWKGIECTRIHCWFTHPEGWNPRGPCKQGMKCKRNDCWFQHPSGWQAPQKLSAAGKSSSSRGDKDKKHQHQPPPSSAGDINTQEINNSNAEEGDYSVASPQEIKIEEGGSGKGAQKTKLSPTE